MMKCFKISRPSEKIRDAGSVLDIQQP